jgi:flagellar biosynthesis repressor protein FlbT
MPLRVELKPGERVIIGNAVIRNGEQRTRFFIEGEAPILREKDILTSRPPTRRPSGSISRCRSCTSTGTSSGHNEVYFPLVRDFLAAAPSAMPIIAEVNNHLLTGDFYKALKEAKKLIAFEEEALSHVSGG